MKIKLYVVVDSGGRIYWTSGEKSWIPEKYMNDPQFKIVMLRGNTNA